VLSLASTAAGEITEPLDRSLLAQLSTVVAEASRAFEAYDHTAALSATEAFFWQFCDDYIELVKERSYGSSKGAASAQATLAQALDVQLRLFAPFLPYVTEEVWSWYRSGSIHRTPWPAAQLVDGDPAVLAVTSDALGHVRRAKSQRSLSMRAEVARVEVRAPQAVLASLLAAERDLRAAGRIIDLGLIAGDGGLTVDSTF
jgi:valyl-tRNA synthetase